MVWRVDVLTLYPEAFPGALGVGVVARAAQEGLWHLRAHSLRLFATDRHQSVDDTPAGGGPGMVMRVDVLARAIDSLPDDDRPLLMMSPRAPSLSQKRVGELSRGSGIKVICPRFEGYDERIISRRAIETVSLGDVIYAGGEVAAMAMIEACVRLLPDALGDARSVLDESFVAPLLEHAHYTRPVHFEEVPIPEVLRSGNHRAIEDWRQQERQEATQRLRPDLWQLYNKK